jgi:uncharacterized protein DUF4339
MGIRFLCPNGHKLNVKAFQAGRRGICPFCGAKFQIPSESTLQAGQASPTDSPPEDAVAPGAPIANGGNAFEQNLEVHLQQAEAEQAASNESPTPAAWAAQPSDSGEPEQTLAEEPESADAPTPETAAELGPAATAQDDAAVDEQPDTAPAPVQAPSHPDPLAETPNAVWYVRPPSGGQFGPAQAEMMRGWLTEGRVSAETLVWREGWADWQEAGSVFPQLQSAASAAPEAPPVATSGADATSSHRSGPRRRKSGPSMGLIAVLVVAVVLLLLVLVYVLTRGTDENPSEQGSAVTVSLTPHRLSETSPSA